VLPQPGVVPQILWLDAANDPLSLADELIELLVGTDVQVAEPLEELGQVLHGRVPEDARLAIRLAREPRGEVAYQLGQFGDERFLGQPHGLVEARRHTPALLLVQSGVELLKVVRGLHAGTIELHGKHASQRCGVVPGVEQRAETLAGCGLQLAVAAVQGLDGLGTGLAWQDESGVVHPGYTHINGLSYNFRLSEADCRFIPYWDAHPPVQVTAGGPDVLVATWRRPGRARVLVSNLSDEDRTVSIRFDAAALGLQASVAATEERTGAEMACAAGAVSAIRVPRHNYAVVLLAAPGKFSPLQQKLAPEMLPQRRIDALCDDFQGLDKAWTVRTSPKTLGGDARDPDPIVAILNGSLRFYGGRGGHMLISRPFNQDDCSVQVRIRSTSVSLSSGGALTLYWDAGRWIQFVGGCRQVLGGDKFHVAVSGSAEPFQPAPNFPLTLGGVNWVKITLRPRTVEFHCTTDGARWRLAGTVARKGLEGPPARLMLGQGISGPQPLLENDGQCPQRDPGWCVMNWFDQLITAKVESR
jgi:hypothetical protein